jgi:hypothetical protein
MRKRDRRFIYWRVNKFLKEGHIVTRLAKERASFLKINDISFFETIDCHHCCYSVSGNANSMTLTLRASLTPQNMHGSYACYIFNVTSSSTTIMPTGFVASLAKITFVGCVTKTLPIRADTDE